MIELANFLFFFSKFTPATAPTYILRAVYQGGSDDRLR